MKYHWNLLIMIIWYNLASGQQKWFESRFFKEVVENVVTFYFVLYNILYEKYKYLYHNKISNKCIFKNCRTEYFFDFSETFQRWGSLIEIFLNSSSF